MKDKEAIWVVKRVIEEFNEMKVKYELEYHKEATKFIEIKEALQSLLTQNSELRNKVNHTEMLRQESQDCFIKCVEELNKLQSYIQIAKDELPLYRCHCIGGYDNENCNCGARLKYGVIRDIQPILIKKNQEIEELKSKLDYPHEEIEELLKKNNDLKEDCAHREMENFSLKKKLKKLEDKLNKSGCHDVDEFYNK